MSSRHIAIATTLVLVALCILVGHQTVERLDESNGVDFYQFWLAPRAVREFPERSIYRKSEREKIARHYARALRNEGSRRLRWVSSQRGKGLVLTASPLRYSVFAAFRTSDYERDFRRWQIASLIALSGGIVLLFFSLGLPWRVTLGFLALTFAGSLALRVDLLVGNVNAMHIGLFIGALWMVGHPRDWRMQLIGGFGLAFLGMFKFTLAPAAFVVWCVFLLQGAWRPLKWVSLGAALGIAAGLTYSAYIFGGLEAWLDWLPKLRTQHNYTTRSLAKGNMGLKRVVRERGGIQYSYYANLAVVMATLMLLWKGRNWNREVDPADTPARRRRHVFLAAGMGVATMLLIASGVQVQYLLLLIPLAAALLWPPRVSTDGEAGRWIFGGLALAAYFATLIYPLEGFVPKSYRFVLGSGGTLVLYALGARALIRQSDAPWIPARRAER